MFDPCPNKSCDHLSMDHDIYDFEDPYPTCCAEGCRCGHPGEAILARDDAGGVTVIKADPVIRVSRELLDQAEPWAWDGEILTLDTAGTHRYRMLRPDPHDEQRVAIFGRERS